MEAGALPMAAWALPMEAGSSDPRQSLRTDPTNPRICKVDLITLSEPDRRV